MISCGSAGGIGAWRTGLPAACMLAVAVLCSYAPARAREIGAPADSAAEAAVVAPADTTAAREAVAPPDSAAAAEPDTAAAPKAKRPASRFDPGLDRDRVEIGAGPVRGYFDAVGSVGYRRYVRERRGWAQFAVGELSGAKKDYLTEGAGSVYYLFRNRRTWNPDWRVRPILEAGPGLHLAVQSAHLVGFNERPFHAKAFFKVHAYAGVEAQVTPRVGLLVRGRVSVPDHRPLDYAQVAILLR